MFVATALIEAYGRAEGSSQEGDAPGRPITLRSVQQSLAEAVGGGTGRLGRAAARHSPWTPCGELLAELAQAGVPAPLVHAPLLVVGEIRVVQRHEGVVALLLEGDRHHRLEPGREGRHPRVLDAPVALDGQEATVVSPGLGRDQRERSIMSCAPAIRHVKEEEEPVDAAVENQLPRIGPGVAWVLGIHPRAKDLGGGRLDRSGQRQLHRLHGRHDFFFPFSFLKYCSRRSRRWLQNCSYTWTHCY